MDTSKVIRYGKEAGLIPTGDFSITKLEHFVSLIQKDLHELYSSRLNAVALIQREKLVRWMMERGYATGHAESIEELLLQLEWQINERIARGQ